MPLSRTWAEHGTGEVIRYADDFVVLCDSWEQAEQAQWQATAILGELGLSLHPDKTRVVDLREGRQGFDFLGCHFHARMSGKLWQQRRIIRYYLHRWPSVRSMKRARAKPNFRNNLTSPQVDELVGVGLDTTNGPQWS